MKQVFVVDDDADIREVILFALENESIPVSSFENGKKALDHLKSLDSSEYPCLIIIDYLMPILDGVSFIKKIKADYPDTLGKIPIIISSAMGTFDQDLNGLENVIQFYKPMDLDELLKVVRKYTQVS